MAKVTVPPKTATVVSGGTANDIVIGNGGASPLALNTTSPETDGAAIMLGVHDSVVMAAGSAWAAATWYGWSDVGTVAVVTEP